MKCPHCQSENPERAIFCIKCGLKIIEDAILKCPDCGTELREDHPEQDDKDWLKRVILKRVDGKMNVST